MTAQRNWIKFGLIALLSFLIGAFSFWAADKFLLSPASQPEKQETIKVVAPKQPQLTTAVEAITVGNFEPIVDTSASPKVLSIGGKGSMSVYDPVTKKTQTLKVKYAGGGGTVLVGKSSPILSPSKKLIAYLKKDDGNLWIVNTAGKNNTKISTQALEATDLYFGTSLLISGWSSDERFLVYHAEIKDESYGGPVKGQFKPSVLEGFYVADMKLGKVYFLPNLPNFIGFIPNSNNIVLTGEGKKRADLFTYDVISGEIKQLTKKDMLGSWSHQFSFSSDGKYYAYVEATTSPSSYSKLIYTTIDNANKQVLAQGKFADVQWPHISPNGKLIAYHKRKESPCPNGSGGCPLGILSIYNLQTKKTKQLGEIKKILYWFDDSRVVVLEPPYSGPWPLKMINIKTGKSTKISDNDLLR